MVKTYKLVFHVEDVETKDIVIEKSQMVFVLSDEVLKKEKQELNGGTPEKRAFIDTAAWKMKISEITNAVGVSVGVFIRKKIIDILSVQDDGSG